MEWVGRARGLVGEKGMGVGWVGVGWVGGHMVSGKGVKMDCM